MPPNRVKYPRIPHLPWSHGKAEDDIALDSIEHLERLEAIAVTERLDVENTIIRRKTSPVSFRKYGAFLQKNRNN